VYNKYKIINCKKFFFQIENKFGPNSSAHLTQVLVEKLMSSIFLLAHTRMSSTTANIDFFINSKSVNGRLYLAVMPAITKLERTPDSF